MSTLDRAFPVARRTHRCCSCGGRIDCGERYHRWKGTGDAWPGVATLKECADCFVRYGRHVYLSSENRALADAWLLDLGIDMRVGMPGV